MMAETLPAVVFSTSFLNDGSSFYAWVFPNYRANGERVVDEIVDVFTTSPGYQTHEMRIRMLAEESVANAIKHAYSESSPRNTVLVTAHIQEGIARLVVADDGPGFDPDLIPDPRDEENLDKPSGRGLLLMSNFLRALNGDMQYFNRFTNESYSGPNILRMTMATCADN
ncbi:hypothetical protein GF386_02810 [Candidatus Pacearchaeota archaeon]|nr:hypothetical protein [Candidatus Pacearchaeota archaeon]MBD3283079.1 hypothetical protein [Candidatus Pacearchaeota archaeon]